MPSSWLRSWRRSSSRSRSMLSRMFCWSVLPPPGTNGANAEPTGPVARKLPKSNSYRLAAGVHGLREEGRVGRHAVGGVGHARHARVQAAQTGAERLLGMHDRIDEVVADLSSRDVRAHDRQLLGTFRELGKRRAERHARKRRGDLAIDAANAVRSAHLRVEGLELGRPAEQVQEDDRLAGGDGLVPGGQGRAPRRWGRDRPPRPSVPMRRNSRRE